MKAAAVPAAAAKRLSTLIRNYGDVLRSRNLLAFACCFSELGQECVEVTAGKGPLEWFGGPLVASLEGHHVPLQIGQALEVAGGKQLALNDGEVDLDLIEPTGVNRRVNQNDVGPSASKAVGSASTTVAGAIVGNQVCRP